MMGASKSLDMDMSGGNGGNRLNGPCWPPISPSSDAVWMTSRTEAARTDRKNK